MTMLGWVYHPWSALHSIRWLQLAVLGQPAGVRERGTARRAHPAAPAQAGRGVSQRAGRGSALLGWLAMRTFTARVLA
ncbi:MAG TPA: hypothetical protein VMH35_02935 [Streptosporangiaceae bacterium]|nr:hypothetical protein [Streptosporangiaceae bacterium]